MSLMLWGPLYMEDTGLQYIVFNIAYVFENDERNLIQSTVQMTNDGYAVLVEWWDTSE